MNSQPHKIVKVTADLTDAEAMAFAQLLKRIGWRDYRANASSDDEAYLMHDAGSKIRAALVEQGYAPR